MGKIYPKIQKGICGAGLALLAALFLWWLRGAGNIAAAELCAALLSLLLFAALCLRFVPQWFSLWFGPAAPELADHEFPLFKILMLGLLCAAAHFAAVWGILYYVNQGVALRQYLDFWRCADAYHYLCIARDWYLPEGDLDRVVQLVFLPGYPIAVRIALALIGDDVLAGMLVSTISFLAALCVFYRLVCLDHTRDTALRAAVFLCLTPGAFFFFAPMSESFFLLLSVSCLYSARKRRWLLAGFFGALASFTRSLGLMLFVPLLMEMITELLHGRKDAWRALASLALVPLGFAGYCLINDLVAGDPFQFLIYQREHWHQSLGFFFDTAAYQLRYAIGADRNTLMGLWLPNLTAIFVSLAILIAGAKKLRASYTLWAIAYYVVSIGATWLLSAPRYLAVLLPIPMSLALLGEKKQPRIVLYLLSAGCELYYLSMFALRRNVW